MTTDNLTARRLTEKMQTQDIIDRGSQEARPRIR